MTVAQGKRMKKMSLKFKMSLLAVALLVVLTVVLNPLAAQARFEALNGGDAADHREAPAFFKTRATKWNTTTLTYRIGNCPVNLDCEAAKQAVREAVEAWDDASGLTLNEVTEGGDILISWFNPGDAGYPFDGKGGTIARAAYPGGGNPLDGDVQLDGAENWAVGTTVQRFPAQVHLKTAVMHEVGHALGLEHSTKPSALMWTTYSGIRSLTTDDIEGIQSLYGK